jgi:hypothetical protein
MARTQKGAKKNYLNLLYSTGYKVITHMIPHAYILVQQETVTYEGNSLTSRKRKVFIPLRVFLLHM